MKSYKSLLLCSALALSVSAYGADALAEGNLEVFVDKDKDVTVDLTITKTKDIFIDVFVFEELDGAAEVDSVINQETFANTVSRSDKDEPSEGEGQGGTFNAGDGIRLDALINDSYNGNSGIVQVNQDVGYMSNQGNVAAIAVVNSADDGRDFADAEESAEQRTEDNSVSYDGGLGIDSPDSQNAVITDPDRQARILDSLNGNSGVVHVNQNAGAMNNQLNDVGLAVADESAVVALAEADLGQFNSFNFVDELNTVKQDVIRNSINGNQAIVNVNQSAGNMNNQGTVISFSGLADIN